MTIDGLIEEIERKFPDFTWLVRSVEEGEDRDRIGAPYFAHIHGPKYVAAQNSYDPSYKGLGETPLAALASAFDAATL